MKFFVDQNKTEREIHEGEWVYLRLQPYRQATVVVRRNMKLTPKFYGSFKIFKKIGRAQTRIHPIFCVSLSLLKKKLGKQITTCSKLPQLGPKGQMLGEQIAALDRRIVKQNNHAVVQVMVQWSTTLPSEATWEDWEVIMRHFPNFCSKNSLWVRKFLMGKVFVTNQRRTQKIQAVEKESLSH